MINLRMAVVALGIVSATQPLSAQTLSSYRQYSLGNSLGAVLKASGARKDDSRTLHERPARISELEWRAPYVSGADAQDPVRNVLFSFVDDELYRIVVTYDRDRMEGLTNADVIEAVARTYGAIPMHERASDSPPVDMPADTTVVARWDDGASVLSLVRGGYSRELKLVLLSKGLGAEARRAIAEAIRLDAQEAPQRELDQRKKTDAEALISGEKARRTNKAAFRP